MHLSIFLPFVFAAAPLAVSAKGTLGYALGVRREDTSCKSTDDFVEDFKVLQAAGYPSHLVRTYAVIDGGAEGGPLCYVPGAILPAAKQTGTKVLLGLWIDPPASGDPNSVFDKELNEVMKYAKDYSDSIYAYTVGSEGLYRHENDQKTGYTAEFLLDKINKLKNSLKDEGLSQKVGTADSWNKYQDGTADSIVSGGADILLINAFGYWQSQDIANASATYLDDLQQAFGHIQDVSGSTTSPELWTGETGWTTQDGNDFHDPKYTTTAKGGKENAEIFYKHGVCAALDWNFNVFYFEAFDEPWKPDSLGLGGQLSKEKYWGAFGVDRKQVLSDLSC